MEEERERICFNCNSYFPDTLDEPTEYFQKLERCNHPYHFQMDIITMKIRLDVTDIHGRLSYDQA